MRAFIEHRGHYNFFGFRPKFTLYLSLEFSNEERAIVRTRALQNYVFDLSPGYLGSSESRYSRGALSAMQIGAIVLFLLSFTSIFIAAFVNSTAVSFLTFIGLAGSVVLFWHSIGAARREQDAFLKQLTLGELVANPTFSVQTIDPAQAPTLEENIRVRLANLKHFLTQTHELATLRSFEI